MAPTKPTKSKGSSSKGSKGRSSAPPKSRATSKPSASKQKSKIPPKQHKPQQSNNRVKKKPRKYTDAELGIPKLNMITPAGVQKVKGKKKGKVFVDDPASMMTILAMVNADKEGQIESKMMRERQMQEIREARHKEMEAKQQEKKDKLEATKKSLRRSKKTKSTAAEDDQVETEDPVPKPKSKSGKKRVSFA